MITKAELKHLTAYRQSKYRNKDNVFVVEGVKMYEELTASDFDIVGIYATETSFEKNNIPFHLITKEELQRISLLTTANRVYCTVRKPKPKPVIVNNRFTLVLDRISDPGNMGTILRCAEWFGLENVVCSKDCVDIFNPKVVQASMGSVFRVNVIYDSLDVWLQNLPSNFQIFGMIVENGEDIYQVSFPKEGIIITGSESFGITPALKPFINRPLTVRRFSLTDNKPESLNASIATAVVLSEICRKLH